jgi:pyruvate formate lyase activating enzyme
MIQNAAYWQKEGSQIRCNLCPHHCLLSKGKKGICSVRLNEAGTLKTENFGEITAMHVDPVEKKPLYHFKPGKRILSVGTYGCNLSCDFCQNYSIAHYRSKSEFLPPDQLAASCTVPDNNIGIAFTYNEPVVWFEYILETAKILKKAYPDLSIVLVTNGYIEAAPLEELLPYVDAMNIDLKSMQQRYYHRICGGSLQPVLRTIEMSYTRCHIEVTTLLVNGLNDTEEEIEEIAAFISNLDKNIPLHISRYFPAYKMSRPATDIEVIKRAAVIAKKHLHYVYLGNMPGVDNSTYCHKCGKQLIYRAGYSVRMLIERAECPACNISLPIII